MLTLPASSRSPCTARIAAIPSPVSCPFAGRRRGSSTGRAAPGYRPAAVDSSLSRRATLRLNSAIKAGLNTHNTNYTYPPFTCKCRF